MHLVANGLYGSGTTTSHLQRNPTRMANRARDPTTDAGTGDSAAYEPPTHRLPLNSADSVAKTRPNPLMGNSGGPGRTRTCNQTVMSGRL